MTTEGKETSGLLPQNVSQSHLNDLWLQSRVVACQDRKESNSSIRPVLATNQFRPLTWRNLKLSFQLYILCFPFFVKLLCKAHKTALVFTVICAVISGILPAAQTWLGAKLLDEVQVTLTTGHIRLDEVKFYAALIVALSLFDLIFHYISILSSRMLEKATIYLAETLLSESKLRMDISGLLEPFRRDCFEAADIFCARAVAIDRSRHISSIHVYN